jgi:hypothetical protein
MEKRKMTTIKNLKEDATNLEVFIHYCQRNSERTKKEGEKEQEKRWKNETLYLFKRNLKK